MPTGLVTGPSVMQNSLYLPQQWPKPSAVHIAPTHEEMARLCWPR